MKIALHSDLHLEGQKLPYGFLENDDFDVLVLAGDIVTHKSMTKLNIFRDLVPEKPIIYVPGNHEYYHGSIEDTNNLLYDLCDSLSIHFLCPGCVDIEGVRFIGTTGWSDLTAYSQFEKAQKVYATANGIADFRVVDGFTVEDMVKLSALDKEYIRSMLEVTTRQKTVVVSHTAPTMWHGNDRYLPNPVSAYFCNDWVEMIAQTKPDYWFYGHTHGYSEASVGHTEFFTNQRGYGSENAGIYDPNRIIEV